MNIKAISSYVGKALLINALFMFFALIISICDGFDEGYLPLSISLLITAIVGSFPFIFVRSKQEATSLSDAFLTIVLSWTLSFLFGMLPYVLYGGEFTLINAWFESVSGYTTTGSTILTEIESMPRSMLFWRSSTHFIGGLGVVIFLLLVLPDAMPFKHKLSSLEISTMSKGSYRYKSGKVARIMLSVYIGMAIVETLLLWAAGMSLYDALNHSFTTVSTGGFSTKNTSIMYFDSALIDVIIIVFMIMSATHFGVIYAAFSKRSFKPLKNNVTTYYLSLIAVFTAIATVNLLTSGTYNSFGEAFLDSLFQVSSYVSTTGFGNADNASWPVLTNVLLLFAAFHCGCSGSTTGGIKADRMFVAIKAMVNDIRHRLHPTSLFRTRVDNVPVKEEVISSVFLYIVAYVFILLISFCIVLACGLNVNDAFSGTVVSIGNTGPGIGSTIGTMGNYAQIPDMVKFVFTIDMFLGRVEIFPILIVLSTIFRKK